MGMMTKMRSLAPWFIITVGGLFVLFMVLSDSKVTQLLGQRSNVIGSIDGEDITYQQFASYLERALENQRQQTGRDIDESQMDAFRAQVWDLLIGQKILESKIREYDITISDDEIREAILGPNPPAFLKQNFIDSTGQFNRALYDQAIMDPRNRDIMIQAEALVRDQKVREKMQSYVSAAVFVSENELKRSFMEKNIKMNADYVFIDVNQIKNEDVTLTEEMYKKYYDENPQKFKVDAQRKVKYVLFRKEPSKYDSTGIKNNLLALAEDLKADSSSFKTYVDIYSDVPWSRDTLTFDLLDDASKDALSKAEENDLVGPVLAPQGYILYKFNEKVKADKELVRASHILIKSTPETDDEAKDKARKLYNQLKAGSDFATLAKENSEDPGSGMKGGDLGWFGKGQMVKEFENACFRGKIDVVQKPVKTSYGYHIIKVTGKSKSAYVVEKITNKIVPSATTVDKLYNKAKDFSYLAENNGFDAAAEEMGLKVLESRPFKEDATNIPGVGANSSLRNFIFQNGVGTVSDVYRVAVGYTVVEIAEKLPAGTRPYEDIKAMAVNNVNREVKMEKALAIAADIKTKIGESGDLEKAKEVFADAKVATATGFTASGNISGIGVDNAFGDFALHTELNKLSDPVHGKRGAFLINVISRTAFDTTSYNLQKNLTRNQILQQRKNKFFNEWLESLKEDADIEDNRHMFYR